MRVLIADDDPIITNLLQDYLELTGEHEIALAHSGAEALQKVAEQKPDLIILDLFMPGMNGYRVVEILKSEARTANIPIILSSALDEVSSEERTRMGVLEFLPKPINFQKLMRLVYQAGSPAERFFGWERCA